MFTFAFIALVVGLTGCEKAMEMMPDGEMHSDGITIGLALAETGDNAEPYGLPMLRGLELAQEELNMQGANIMFVREDNMSTTEGSKAAVQALVGQGVPAIIGIGISTQLKEAFPIAQEAGVVAFSPISSAAGLSGEVGDYAFRAGLATNILIPGGVMQTLAAVQYTSAAIIYDDADTYSTSVKDELVKALAEAGVTLSNTENFVTTDTDFETQLTAIKDMGPEVVFVAALSTQMVQIIMQADELEITSQLIVPDLTSAEVTAAGAAAEGAIAFAGWSELDDNPKNQAFVQSYMAKHGSTPSPWAAQAYATMNILANAIAQAGTNDSMAIRDALAMTSQFDTVLGPFSFDADGEAIYEQIVVLQVKEGVLQVPSIP
jgi:branched-chain amino acid transport system substrate-binding protein